MLLLTHTRVHPNPIYMSKPNINNGSNAIYNTYCNETVQILALLSNFFEISIKESKNVKNNAFYY